MKIFLVLFSLFLIITSFGQSSNNILVFQNENFLNASGETITRKDTFKVKGLINLDFYRHNYFVPYYYPDQFMDNRFKNQLVVVWSDSSLKKDYRSNWTHSYMYDEKHRVIEYSYSGCFFCSQLPYTLRIFYDGQDRPINLEMSYNDGQPLSKRDATPGRKFLLNYDSNGNIIMLEHYDNGVLIERITKM